MKNVFILAHNSSSKGAEELANALDIKRIKHDNSRFVPRASKTLINWGNSEINPQYKICSILNCPERVKSSSNKLTFFEALKATSKARLVPNTTSLEDVRDWLTKGYTVVARTLLNSFGGKGIIFFDLLDRVPKAALYTKYIKKSNEYRVHFFKSQVISLQEKRFSKEKAPLKEVDHRLRNLENGYIFARENVSCPEDVILQAQLAFESSGLDFGAIDVLWNANSKKAFVLEINSAPGLEGTTVRDYEGAFKQFFEKGI